METDVFQFDIHKDYFLRRYHSSNRGKYGGDGGAVDDFLPVGLLVYRTGEVDPERERFALMLLMWALVSLRAG